MENFESIREQWPSLKIQLKLRYPQLNEGDLEWEEGYAKEMFKNLQIKTGKSREEFLDELNSILMEQ